MTIEMRTDGFTEGPGFRATHTALDIPHSGWKDRKKSFLPHILTCAFVQL